MRPSYSSEKKFASEMNQDILSKEPLIFEISGVKTTNVIEADLRLGICRSEKLSLAPIVEVNGKVVQLPVDNMEPTDGTVYKGGIFFGVFEIPLSQHHLSRKVKIRVLFPDSGGTVTTVAIQSVRRIFPEMKEKTLCKVDFNKIEAVPLAAQEA